MKAHYVIIQAQGQQVPVVFPAEAVELASEAAKLGHPVSGGECELRAGVWTAWGEIAVAGVTLRSRQTHDVHHLHRHFGDGLLVAGQPFTTRPEGPL